MQPELDNLINDETRQFVASHAADDVPQLALRGTAGPGVNLPLALDQIAGRRYARRKLPAWAATEGIIYPPHLSMEQCSSEATARYKASIVSGDTMADLTGGLGVDCSFMARAFNKVVYVEKVPMLCKMAKHNFHLLGNDNITVVNSDAESFLSSMEPVDLIFIDPARRDHDGRRTYDIADCTPDVTVMAQLLLSKARQVMIKLSPMLDVSRVIQALPCVTQVHIVSTAGECKEMLVIMSHTAQAGTSLHCVNDDDVFSFSLDDTPGDAPLWDEKFQPETALFAYEPNASAMKAACFNHLAKQYGMSLMSRDSHLLIADKLTHKFPGRAFVVRHVSTLNKKEIKQALTGITTANVAVRNFPLRAAELAKRLRLHDGGDNYIFGTTTASGRHIILVCSKITT